MKLVVFLLSCAFLVLDWISIRGVFGFASLQKLREKSPRTCPRPSQTRTQTRSAAHPSFFSDQDPNLFRFDQDRVQLEAQMGRVLFSKRLTQTARRRKQLEIQLLQTLVDSDDAIDQLMDLWLHEGERGSTAALLRMQDSYSMDTPAAIQATEATLRGMITPDWPEPASRLALLLLVQHRHEECLQLLDQVLQIKPWHFEARHMQVLLALRMEDPVRALRANRSALPPLTQPKKRVKWVAQAVTDAAHQLYLASEANAKAEAALVEPSAGAWQ